MGGREGRIGGMSQRLPKNVQWQEYGDRDTVSGDRIRLTQKLLKAPRGSQKLPEAPRSFQRLREAPRGSQRVSKAPRGVQKLPEGPRL